FDVGNWFALYFGITALAVGAAFFVNAYLVRRLGMHFIVFWSLIVMGCLAAAFFTFEFLLESNVPLPAFMSHIIATSFCMGMLFGNFNALAMIPMGHMAGIA